MKLDSSNTPIYLPDTKQTSVLRLGFKNCAVDNWIFTANNLKDFNQHKRKVGSSLLDRCYAASPESTDAQNEFYDHLLEHLVTFPKLGYGRQNNSLIHKQEALSWEIQNKNLWQASLWVPEDFCLLEKIADDFVMTAASICSPSNWILEEKIGQTVDFIHGPVPGYDKELSERVNRFLSGLPTNRVLLRYNWSIQPGNELFWRDDLDPAFDTISSVCTNMYWRIERQTFIRLPKSKAIVFGIRIFLHSFDSLGKTAGFNKSIEQLIEQLPADQKHYKGLTS